MVDGRVGVGDSCSVAFLSGGLRGSLRQLCEVVVRIQVLQAQKPGFPSWQAV